MTRDEEIACHRRRARKEMLRSVSVRGAGINAILTMSKLGATPQKADAVKFDRNWRPTPVDG